MLASGVVFGEEEDAGHVGVRQYVVILAVSLFL